MSPQAASGHSSSCADGCDSCPLASATAADQAPFKGVRFGLISLAYFIFPALSALIASRLLGAADRDLGALGAIAGLVIGVVGSALVVRRLFPPEIQTTQRAMKPASASEERAPEAKPRGGAKRTVCSESEKKHAEAHGGLS